MMSTTSMAREIAEIPVVVSRQIELALEKYVACGQQLAKLNPPALLTCARGTSDQAATYFKYLMETQAGVPVASLGPSVVSVYDAPLKTEGMACLAISQSGGSPDLVQLQARLKDRGAYSVALLNTPDSPLGSGADLVLPLEAGTERAVAATKSFVASLFAGAAIVSGFLGDDDLRSALCDLPEVLEKALKATIGTFPLSLVHVNSLFVLSRGPGMAVAGEAALKLKETCQIHAEAYSAAEVLHGPVALSDQHFGAIAFVPEDAGEESVRGALDQMKEKGAVTVQIGWDSDSIALPKAPHPLLTPLVQITAFYSLVEKLAVAMERNPDSPPGLRKVTETV